MIHICLRQPRQVVQTEPTRKVEKKKKKKGRLWTTDANRLQITVNLKEMRPFEARVSAFLGKFTSKLQVLYAKKPLRFSRIRPKLLMLILQMWKTLQRSCGHLPKQLWNVYKS